METSKFAEELASRLIQQIQERTAPWQRLCKPGQSWLPFNPTSGTRYKGINIIALLSRDFGDPRWMTYRQALGEGYQVRKGEKATQIQYWKFDIRRQAKDSAGRPVLDKKGDPVIEIVPLKRPTVFLAYIFNATQIDGIPNYEKPTLTWDPIQAAERLVQSTNAKIQHNSLEDPYYAPDTDSIHLPGRGRFSSAANYYATLLHELGHWTGHQSRLNRDLNHRYGSQG
jgi:putative DNA primase/helicase